MKGFRNWNEFYQRINLFFHGIIAFSLIPFAYVYLDMEKNKDVVALAQGYEKVILNLVVVVVVVLMVYLAEFRLRNNLKQIPKDLTLREKLRQYLAIQSRKYIYLESAAVVALGATLLTRDYAFVFVYVFILFLFSLSRPKYDRIVTQLNLSKEEQAYLESGKDIP
jgi:hypothetical protein